MPKACKTCTTHKLCVGKNDTETSIRLPSLAKRLYPRVINPIIALLKIDVEAWEHVIFPDWLQDIMKHGSTFSVNQIQMEFHRWGHDTVAGTSSIGYYTHIIGCFTCMPWVFCLLPKNETIGAHVVTSLHLSMQLGLLLVIEQCNYSSGVAIQQVGLFLPQNPHEGGP